MSLSTYKKFECTKICFLWFWFLIWRFVLWFEDLFSDLKIYSPIWRFILMIWFCFRICFVLLMIWFCLRICFVFWFEDLFSSFKICFLIWRFVLSFQDLFEICLIFSFQDLFSKDLFCSLMFFCFKTCSRFILFSRFKSVFWRFVLFSDVLSFQDLFQIYFMLSFQKSLMLV
jgi:hypothetical protein